MPKKKKQDKDVDNSTSNKKRGRPKTKVNDTTSKIVGERPRTKSGRRKRRDSGQWKFVFLRTLRKNANVTESCRMSGISRRTAYNLREVDDKFAEQWDDAVEQALDDLEDAAWERAKAGSDPLMIFLLKVRRGYSDKQRIEMTGANGKPLLEELEIEKRKELILASVEALIREAKEAEENKPIPLQLEQLEDGSVHASLPEEGS